MTNGPSSAEGRVLDGRYRLGSLLGVGGVAEVYRAIDERLHRGVAVKLFRGDVADQLHRHEDEMRTLARLSHGSLVTVFDAGTDDVTQQPYLVMALVEGPTLSDQLAGGAMAPHRVAEIGADVADALAYVHAQGLVHRDVKPANVLISNAGRVFLADFGIARLVDSAHVTQAGDVLGTPSFFAPEQVTGDPVGPPADVYALGLVLLECLTGEREYDGTSLEVAMARLNRPPQIPASLPPAWRAVLSAMTARDAASRPSAAQVSEQLGRIADGDDRTVILSPIDAAPATVAMPAATAVMAPTPPPASYAPTSYVPAAATAPPPPPPRSRRPWIIVAILCVVIAAAAIAAAVIVDRNNNSSGGSCSAGLSGLAGTLRTEMQQLNIATCSSGLPKSAKSQLVPDLATVRFAATGTSRTAMKAAVSAFTGAVQTLHDGGKIGDTQQAGIDAAVQALQTTFLDKHPVKVVPTTPPPSTAPPTAPSTPTAPTPTMTVTTTVQPSTPPVITPPVSVTPTS